ncbi:MAG: hypothetical protein OXR73_38500 [Myxococcales bacterium]|nr:hypothetical protein [Myxococcales bacterium]
MSIFPTDRFSETPDEVISMAQGDGYTAAYITQGVPILDRDLNLMVGLPAYALRQLGALSIGYGVHEQHSGFEIGFEDGELQIGGGVLVAAGELLRSPHPRLPYSRQEPPPPTLTPVTGRRKDLVYLAILEAAVVDDPSDAAVGNLADLGEPTLVRVRTGWQVRVAEGDPSTPDAPPILPSIPSPPVPGAPKIHIPLAEITWDASSSPPTPRITDLRPKFSSLPDLSRVVQVRRGQLVIPGGQNDAGAPVGARLWLLGAGTPNDRPATEADARILAEILDDHAVIRVGSEMLPGEVLVRGYFAQDDIRLSGAKSSSDSARVDINGELRASATTISHVGGGGDPDDPVDPRDRIVTDHSFEWQEGQFKCKTTPRPKLTESGTGSGRFLIWNTAGQLTGSFDSGSDLVPSTFFQLDSAGTLTLNNGSQSHTYDATGKDVAESFAAIDTSVPPGAVVFANREGLAEPCAHPYFPAVIGIVSGANDLHPAVHMGQRRDGTPQVPVALCGTVYCLATADPADEAGSIGVGDLLTSSSQRGHAMKASDRARAFGAVIGKALEPLESGRKLIRVLVMLS